MMRLALVYASVGRADVLRRVVDRLKSQTREPDLLLVSASCEADVAGMEGAPFDPEIIMGSKGLCRQRNRALDHIGDRADIVLFFDDDFVPDDHYLARVDALFSKRPDIAGATGHVIADGIKTPGYTLAEADAFLVGYRPAADPKIVPRHSLYGCNMVLRLSSLGTERFDERLPLYGWLEDIDLTYRLHRRGLLVTDEQLVGVHMGVKGGRVSGVKFGYSQIANPVYMLGRGTIPRAMAYERMARNLLSNITRSLKPESYVDRAGRLRGNLHALADLMTGRLDPERILTMD